MKKSILLIISFLVLVLIVAGCSKTDQQNNTVQPPPQVVVPEPVREVNVVASCDDVNPCTEDFFNNLTQQCEHRLFDQCCGDNTCDGDERCNYDTYETICPEDCPTSCPGFLVVDEEWSCDGSCIETDDYFLVDGDVKFTLYLENIGELPVNSITTLFSCNRPSGSQFIATNNNNGPKNGVTFSSYFNEDSEILSLKGVPYGNNSAIHTFELKGMPEEELQLTCSISFRANDFYQSRELSINFKPVPA